MKRLWWGWWVLIWTGALAMLAFTIVATQSCAHNPDWWCYLG